MSLYRTGASESKRGPRGVWPWFFWAILCVLTYVFAAQALWPWGYPARDELVEAGGDIRRVIIRDHLSGTGAGAAFPTHVSAYITFRDWDGEFEYPWSSPGYPYVRDRVGVYANVLVEAESLDGPGPYRIWGLTEMNSHKPDEDQIIVTYEEIASQLDDQQKTLASMAKWLGGMAMAFILWGWHTIRWNRRNYPDPFLKR